MEKNQVHEDLLGSWSNAPRGVIILWANTASIPHGWAICNGANGTPDLNGRFPLGTSNSAEIGTQSGDAQHTHTVQGVTGYENKHRNLRTPDGFEGEGNECMYHDHNFNVISGVASNMPPSTMIIFLMKL